MNTGISTDFISEVECESCGSVMRVECRTLIDTAKDLDALNKVLDASWFTYECPVCHEKQLVVYPCLFHDGARHTLIAFADQSENTLSYDRFKEMLEGKKMDSPYNKAISGWLGHSTVRLTDDFSSLQEKILLSVLGLDDRCIEACKYINTMILEQQGTLEHVNSIYFNTDGSDYLFVIEDEKGEMLKSPLPRQMYNDVLKQVVPQLPESIIVDQKWISECMRRMAN